MYLHPSSIGNSLLVVFHVTESEAIHPGETGTVVMELYGPCPNPLLHVGAIFEAREGGRVVAEGTITAIHGVQPN